MPRRYNHLDGNYFRGKGHNSFAAEEALGIGLFILVLAILLAFGCWYYKRRSGYKSLRATVTGERATELFTHIGQTRGASKKVRLTERIPNSKSSGVSTIRNVVGEGEILDCKTALQDYRNFSSVVPDAPPAYDKIAADQSPPPYSP